jgi:hypothetical protein
LVKYSQPPAIFPTVYLRVPYLLPYIIFLLSMPQMLESVSWPHLPTTLLFLCLTRFLRWFAAIQELENSGESYGCTSVRNLLASCRKFNGEEIPWSPEVRYLGLNLDRRLNFASHTAKSTNKAERVFRVLYSFLNRRSKLFTQNKLLLYKSIEWKCKIL